MLRVVVEQAVGGQGKEKRMVMMVNEDTHPILVHNEYFTGHLVLRVKDFQGHIPSRCRWKCNNTESQLDSTLQPITNCCYFQDSKRSVSLQVQGRFHAECSGDDLTFGTYFQKPFPKLPHGHTLALKLAQKVDPSMMYDLSGNEPWLASPWVCAMQVLCLAANVPRHWSEASADTAVYHCDYKKSVESNSTPIFLPSQKVDSKDLLREWAKTAPVSDCAIPVRLLIPWQWGESRQRLPEHWFEESTTTSHSWMTSFFTRKSPFTGPILLSTPLLESTQYDSLSNVFPQEQVLSPASAYRRSYYCQHRSHRQSLLLRPDKIYGFEFYSHRARMNQGTLQLGPVSLKIQEWIGYQPVRYVFKWKEHVLFAVELDWL